MDTDTLRLLLADPHARATLEAGQALNDEEADLYNAARAALPGLMELARAVEAIEPCIAILMFAARYPASTALLVGTVRGPTAQDGRSGLAPHGTFAESLIDIARNLEAGEPREGAGDEAK